MRWILQSGIVAVAVALLASPSSARFGQENPPVERAIETFGDKNGIDGTIGGQLATFSGLMPETLLGEAPPCNQADLADKMLDFGRKKLNKVHFAKLQTLVQDYMAAEKNFDPDTAPQLCKVASKPRNAELRGILPLMDPSRGGGKRGGITAKAVNVKTIARLRCIQRGGNCAKLAAGKSVAKQMKILGYTDFKGSASV